MAFDAAGDVAAAAASVAVEEADAAAAIVVVVEWAVGCSHVAESILLACPCLIETDDDGTTVQEDD